MSSEEKRWGRSVVAVLAGIVVGVVLTMAVDGVLHLSGVYPALGTRMPDGLFVLATAYRVVFSVLGSYIIARLAPRQPMAHAMVGGAIGLVVSVIGAVVTWNKDLGPHWYPVLLAVTSLPCAWIGAKLWHPRLQTATARS